MKKILKNTETRTSTPKPASSQNNKALHYSGVLIYLSLSLLFGLLIVFFLLAAYFSATYKQTSFNWSNAFELLRGVPVLVAIFSVCVWRLRVERRTFKRGQR